MAEGGVIIIRFTYTGAEGEIIPAGATHIFVDKGVTFVRAQAFQSHRNIVEVICHDRVEKIEEGAFQSCPNLRRVIMPGVKIVEDQSFSECRALTDVECGKLEIIGIGAFSDCISLRSISLPSTRIVEFGAFAVCDALADVTFGNKLERIDRIAFVICESLERITIPMKDILIAHDDIFQGCEQFKNVQVEGVEVEDNIAALQLKEWRNDMNKEFHSINQNLPNASAGEISWDEEGTFDAGEKAQVIRRWIRSVLDKIDHYKAEHQRMLGEATTLLELAIWKSNLDDTDGCRIVREGVRTTRGSVKRARREICITSGASIVIKNVLPFLQLK
jgi:hypothetical protein